MVPFRRAHHQDSGTVTSYSTTTADDGTYLGIFSSYGKKSSSVGLRGLAVSKDGLTVYVAAQV